jgi:hypothetical protein
MFTIFGNETRLKLVERKQLLNENSQRQWGKMNVYQMIMHCQLCDEMYQGIKSTREVGWVTSLVD